MAYTPPGITVEELTSSTASPVLAAPGIACIVGLSTGAIRRTDVVTLSGHLASPLPGLPAGATLVSTDTTVVVKDSYLVPANVPADYDTSAGYDTADFTLDASAKTIARVSTGGTGDTGDSLIPDGETIYVTYDYIPADYFTPQLYSDLATIEARFGAATDDSGAVVSPLTFGAQMAFEGGAAQLYIAPLFKLTTASDPDSVRLQPSSAEAATAATWQQTLFALRDIDNINLIVPIAGQSQPNVDDSALLSIFEQVQDHCAYMNNEQDYAFMVLGEDSSTDATKATKSTIRGHADILRARHGGVLAQQTVLLNTAKFVRSAPNASGLVYIGGQYEAAAFAGLLSSMSVSTSPTRSAVGGALSVADKRSKQDKLDDGAKGLLVLDDSTGVVVVRHGITLDTSGNVANRQISVVRAKHRVIQSVRDTLDPLLGKTVVNVDAPTFVASAVQGVLERLVSIGDIVSYQNIQARTLTGDPTTVEVRFDYRPAFPLDYIDVKFSLDLTAQTISVG